MSEFDEVLLRWGPGFVSPQIVQQAGEWAEGWSSSRGSDKGTQRHPHSRGACANYTLYVSFQAEFLRLPFVANWRKMRFISAREKIYRAIRQFYLI